MPLRFGVDDEDEFYEAKDQLLAQLEEALGDDGDPEVVGSAGLLLDWRWGYSTGELDRMASGGIRNEDELAELLAEQAQSS